MKMSERKERLACKMQRVVHSLKVIGVLVAGVLAVVLLFIGSVISFFFHMVFLAVGVIGLLLTGIGYEVCVFFGEVIPKYGEKFRVQLRKWVEEQVKCGNGRKEETNH